MKTRLISKALIWSLLIYSIVGCVFYFYSCKLKEEFVSHHFERMDSFHRLTKDTALHINNFLIIPTNDIANYINKVSKNNVDRFHPYSLGGIDFPLSETERVIANLFHLHVSNFIELKGDLVNIIYRSYEGSGRYVFIREQQGFSVPTSKIEREHCQKYRLCTKYFDDELKSGLLVSKIYQDAITDRMVFTFSSPVYLDGEIVGDVVLDYFLDTYDSYGLSYENEDRDGVNYLIIKGLSGNFFPFSSAWEKQLDQHTVVVFEYSMDSAFYNLLIFLPLIFVSVYSLMYYNLKEKKLLIEKSEDAYFDDLTGVYNRKIYKNKLFINATKSQEAAVVMIDGNGIKMINDSFGHHIGDEAIQAIANAMQGVFRKSDYIIRNGGDEFVAVLPGCNNVRAFEIVGIFRNELQKSKLSIPHVGVSVSVGIHMKSASCTLESALLEADAIMYKDKKQR